MDHSWVIWILVAACALHVMEEHAMGWQGWATRTLGPKLGYGPTWSDFWITNAAMIVMGIAAASIGWRAPAFALSLPALCLINLAFFHILPSVQEKRANPGLFTGLLLYLPISVWAYIAAADDGVLSAGTLIGSLAIGAAVMAFAVGALALKRIGYPDEPAVSAR